MAKGQEEGVYNSDASRRRAGRHQIIGGIQKVIENAQGVRSPAYQLHVLAGMPSIS